MQALDFKSNINDIIETSLIIHKNAINGMNVFLNDGLHFRGIKEHNTIRRGVLFMSN